MRTGSNLLERFINQFEHLHCHGELFNPAFVGKEGQEHAAGISLSDRETDPQSLIDAIVDHDAETLPGFRIFDGHDTRVTEAALKDLQCARIILRRRLIDSYVSLKIARKTDQWMLGNIKKRKTAQVEFDPDEFDRHCQSLNDYYSKLRRIMQTHGTTAFELTYEDILDPEVLNGLASYLGQSEQLRSFEQPIKRQNPEPLSQKLTNYDVYLRYLNTTEHETLLASDTSDLPIGRLLEGITASSSSGLIQVALPGNKICSLRQPAVRFANQKDLSTWLDATPGAQSFCMLQHPVDRAFSTFCRRILIKSKDCYPKVRRRLQNHHGVILQRDDRNLKTDELAASFEAFCVFLKANIAGQTGIRMDLDWTPQHRLIETLSTFLPVRRILLPQEVQEFADGTGAAVLQDMPCSNPNPRLSKVYSKRIENLLKAAYPHDYRRFGFGPWSGSL